MTKIKRLVAVALAFLMILGSLSMAAYAWTVGDDGTTLGIETKFFRNVNGEWVETTKVEQGEQIKARVYLSTDYYTNSGDLLFFYNNSFLKGNFTTEKNTLVVNPYYASHPYTITGIFYGEGSEAKAEANMVKRNAITQEFADAHDFIYVIYSFDYTSYNQKFNGNKWFCEFDFTVKADASTADSGNLFVVESTLQSPDFTRGYINIPQGPYNGKTKDVIPMSNWEAKLATKENPVTLFSNKVLVSFSTDDGLFADSTKTVYYEGEAGEALSPEVPKWRNHTFKGWAIKGTDDIVDATVYPSVDTEYVAIWDDNTVADDETVTFETRFYRNIGTNDNPEWVYTERAARGETLKARIFIDTNYFTNAGDVIVFYNNKFFNDKYESRIKQSLIVNDKAGSAVTNGIKGEFVKYTSNDNEVKKLVDKGYITDGFAAEHNAIAINYIFLPDAGKKLIVSDWSSASEEWLFEFELTVDKYASGIEYFQIVESTIMNPDKGVHAFINVPVSTENGLNENVIGLHSINVDKTIDNGFVELNSTLTLDANGGTFAENGEEIFEINGFIGDIIVAPQNPTLDGYTFMGWADEEGNKVDFPATMPYEDTTLTAIWQAEVDISYDTDGDGNVDVTETVTSGQPFVKPEDPTKEGNQFIGWVTEYAPTDILKELPDEYPDTDTTYTAIFDTLSYEVNYYVRDPKTFEYKLVAEVPIPYGELIAHKPSTAYKAPEGYDLSKAYLNVSPAVLLPDDATMPANEVDVYFILEPITVTVTFDALEGAWADGEKTKNVDVVYDTQIVAPEDPVREGYNFIGWTPDVEIMEDIEENYFKAIWEEATYYATFKVDDAVHAKIDHLMGDVIDTPDEPYKEGYTFVGWNNFTEGVTTMPAEDVEFIAVFKLNKYDATFDAGEGFFGTLEEPEKDDEGNVVTEKTVPTDFGAEIKAPADPVREGYTFGGWDPLPDDMPAEDTTYTAIWNANTDTTYTVEYYTMNTKGDGYKLTGTQTMSGTTDAVINVPANAPTGFAINAKKSTYDDGLTIGADGKTVVTVYFDRNAYTITFDGNDGTVNGEESIVGTYYYGASVAVPATEREGYTFLGWKDAEGNDVNVNITATADVTYIAQWGINEYTITFDTVGADAIGPITQEFGTAVTAPEDPDKDGYTFAGWEDADGKPAEVPATMPAKDVTLKATWTPDTFDATFGADGGAWADGSTEQKVPTVFDEDIEVPATNPEKEGYEFGGWVDEEGNAPDQMDTEGREFTAVWNPIDMTIPVEIYYMDADGTYPATPDDNTSVTFKTEEIATVVPAEKENYTVDTEKSVLEAEVAADGSTVLKIYYALNKTAINFNVDGEVTVVEGLVGAEVPAEEVPAPEKEGYTFAGWEAADGSVSKDAPATFPEDDIALKATWTAKEYNVTFDVDGTDVEGYPKKVAFGSSIPVPANPSKGGYVFLGWEDADGKTPAEYGTMPAKDVEFFAQWGNASGVGYVLEVYKMDTNGDYPVTATETINFYDGVVDETRTVEYTAPAGFTLDLVKSKLSGKIPAEGTLVLMVYLSRNIYTLTVDVDGVKTETEYYYGEAVDAVADPEKDGNVEFAGWVDETGADATVPAIMPADDVTVIATWTTSASFDAGEGATFPNGDQVVTGPVELGDPIEAPAEDPIKDGYDFVGWAPADDPENVITDGNFGNMDADGADFVAVWEKATYKVTFYDYHPADTDTVVPTVKTKIVSADYKNEEKIIFPAEVDLYGYENYIFMGWTLAENKPLVTDDYTEEMLANLLVDPATETVDSANADENGEINYYAVYKRVKVMLIPKNDECTTVIDRNGGTVDDYVAGESIWYVYGLEEVLDEELLLGEYVDVQGDGHIEIIYRDRDILGGTHYPWIGTGAVINVYDNVEEKIVESFFIIIFGDLNGDAYVTATDVAIIEDESLGLTWWSIEGEDQYCHYMVKAADLAANDWSISASDYAIIESVALGLYQLDQTDGTYGYY